VTINSGARDYRKREYFWKNLGVTLNSLNPTWQSVSVVAGATTTSGNILLPQSTQSFAYDLDGNLTSDGVWTYYYDAENRLYRIENQTTVTTTSARKKLIFEYDHIGRRIRKQAYDWASTDYSGTATTDTKFFWDGWNLIKETTGSGWKA
jgi:hypothetical protein